MDCYFNIFSTILVWNNNVFRIKKYVVMDIKRPGVDINSRNKMISNFSEISFEEYIEGKALGIRNVKECLGMHITYSSEPVAFDLHHCFVVFNNRYYEAIKPISLSIKQINGSLTYSINNKL